MAEVALVRGTQVASITTVLTGDGKDSYYLSCLYE